MNFFPCIMMVASLYAEPQGLSCNCNGTKKFNPNAYTAAHKDRKLFPCCSYIFVTFRSRTITILINDHGPNKKGRDIDLSSGAAKMLEFPGSGKVCVRRIE